MAWGPTDLVELRRALHRRAEPPLQEHETAACLAEVLERTRPDDLRTGVGQTGIVACYDGPSDGPTILLRAELDALPIQEVDEVPWSAYGRGFAHKCGHDGHMAILAGVAQGLGEARPARGRVVLLFQPAEEPGAGAQSVLDDPRFGDIEPDHAFAIHNIPGYPMGDVIVRPGPFAAASRGLVVHLEGESVHAAEPESGNSPAQAMAQLILDLETMGGRPPVTVVQAWLGEQGFGTTPGRAYLAATLRRFDDGAMEKVARDAEARVFELAEHHGLHADVDWHEVFETTVNDPEAAAIVTQAARRLGVTVHEPPQPFFWSEDFSLFTRRFEGAILGLGSGREQPTLHAEDYDFPDELLEPGVRVYEAILDEALAS